MSMTDSIASYLTLIRNASRAKKKYVDCPSSKVKEQITDILKKKGYILNYKKIEDKKQSFLRLYLKYDKTRKKICAISNLRKISKPGRRVYQKSDEIKSVLGGIGIAVISTSKGIKTDNECRNEKIGGETLCHIW